VSAPRFHPAARTELRAAASFYESRLSGLGAAFVAEIERISAFVASRPTAGAPLGQQLRRISVRRFPFTIIYRLSSSGVDILAVAHQRRRPGYWRDRE
jgi:toxin ParE1/3/4